MIFSSSKNPAIDPSERREHSVAQRPEVTPVALTSRSLFIPYWNIPDASDDLSAYETLIYFGVAPDTAGSLKMDDGRLKLQTFIDNTPRSSHRFLTIRMLDTAVNQTLLENETIEDRVITNSNELAKQYGFDGIVLDLEMGVLPFSGVQEDITAFITAFTQAARGEDLSFAITLYGDTFYRQRPYDVARLASVVDEVYIMAYDLHKSHGEPGANFTFEDDNEYDFKQMVTDYTAVVPREKLAVIFGMYGYDWTLGSQGKPLKAANAIPLNQIDEEGAIGDPVSREKHIIYTDADGFDHELWYEDEESANVKIEYLKQHGIGRVGYWVWGYF